MHLLSRFFVCWALLVLPVAAQRLTPLAPIPDWSRLEVFQEKMTKAEFQRLLETIYAPGGASAGVVEVRETEAIIYTTLVPAETMTLRFAPEGKTAGGAKTYWRPLAKLPGPTAKKPLAGLRLALDAGHLGGQWGLMEERSFAKPGETAVQEGDMTLRVVQRVAKEARRLGAKVSLVREKAGPIAPFTVEAFYSAAEKELALLGINDVRQKYDGPRDPLKMNTVQWQAEKLFYRVAEIRERGRKVNRELKPDLLVCVHFNADDWSDPAAPVFTPRNDVHVLVHGCYSASELRFDDQRCEMLVKLLNRSHVAELEAAKPMVEALAKATGLPAFSYLTGNASRVITGNEFIWARNLLANRLYECPVVFLEPYRMNNEEVYARIQAGDYEGEREVAGKLRPSIYREYAEGVIAGLLAWREGESKK